MTQHVPARDIPVPTSVSKEAQATIALGPVGLPPEYPAVDDLDAWRAMLAEREAAELVMLAEASSSTDTGSRLSRPAGDTRVVDLSVDRTTVYVITPEGVSDDDPRVYLELHGGGFIHFGGQACRAMATSTAELFGVRVWSVDYRMPPDWPYPTPLDDCLAGYRALLKDHRPEEIIVGGPSAGGNLTAALILRARDEGLPVPAGAVLMSPGVDLTETGDTWRTNMGLDNVLLGSYMPAFLLYAAGHDLRDPYLSPIFGDFAGFPPTILTSGTRDALLSDTVRTHRAMRAAGVAAELHVWEAASHAMFLRTAPEDVEHLGEIRRFMNERWARR